METFDSWRDVLAHARKGAALYYKAPLDFGDPRRVTVVKVYKNGKIRLRRGDVIFTADDGHLDRMRRKP